MVLLMVLSSINVNGEDYVIQSGDVLSTIAKKKMIASGLPMNLQQIMLTIYKFNPDVFVNGDIDHLIPGKQIYIPDNAADFVPISKADALNRLHDKHFLRGLYSSASALKLTGDVAKSKSTDGLSQNYAQIQQVLDNHQKNIELLKTENSNLSKSFKLLERALGRIVIIQGMLTNDVVKVKSKLFTGSVAPNSASLPDVLAAKEESSPNAKKSEPVPMPLDGAESKSEITPAPVNVASSQQDFKVPETSEVAAGSVNVASEVKSSQGTNQPEKLLTEPINTNQEVQEDGLWSNIAILLAIIVPMLLVLLWFIDFRQIRTKLKKSKSIANTGTISKNLIKDRLVVASDASRYANDNPEEFDSNDDVGVVRIKTDKSIKENGFVDRITELGGVMELLDMCLLFGDYQQAQSVALKALSENQNLPILSKKLAIIERKLAKY